MPKRVLPPNETLIEMYNSGLSSREIASELGANINTVLSGLRAAGCKMRANSEAQLLRVSKPGYKPNKPWLGKKQPPEMVEKRIAPIRGENHYLWNGGKSKRDYRKVVTKIRCSVCASRLNLGIRHKNLDHYDNSPENLEVLCVSCHAHIHKQAYWDAIHAGEVPQRSNAPVGWKRGGE